MAYNRYHSTWTKLSAVLVITLATLLLFPAISRAHSKTQVIEITPDGFSPDPVTVDENSAVIFINKDSVNRWPASNVHPTHELYPEFDPKRPLSPGESWSFKPNKLGTHKYHDHLLPHKRGTLTVEGEQGAATGHAELKNKDPSFFEAIKRYFSGLLNNLRSLFNHPKTQKQLASAEKFVKLPAEEQNKALKDYSDNLGSQAVWKFILDTYKGQAGSSGNIHDLAHLAGSLMYEKGGFGDLGFCSTEFAFGCFHGFLDRAFKDNLDYLPDALDACLKLGPALSGPVASCIHGIGHGVASFYSTKDLKKSLSACRTLVNGKDFCFDGVFMEFVRSAPDSFYKADDPLYPCNQLEKEFGYTYSFSCGRNQPSLLMNRFGKGFDEVTGVCLSSTSKPFKEACFDALGFSVASEGEVDGIIASCKKIAELEYQIRCIKAAAGELVFQEVPGWQSKAPQVCDSQPSGQSECTEHVQRLIKEYGRQEKESFQNLKTGENINVYIKDNLKTCYGTGGKDGCYQKVAKTFYNQFGLSKTLGLLQANEGEKEVYARCHEVTHYLSRFEYEKQKNIAKVYAQCDSTCHGGCYHGTLEAYLRAKQLQQDSNLSELFPNICGKASDYQKPLEFNECLHGLGHAAMFVTDMELKSSLLLCDTLNDENSQSRCYTGVFMENSSSSTSFDHKSKYIKADDPFYPCNSLEERYRALCWQYQSSYFSILNNQDWSKVAQLCLQIPQMYQDLCFRTIGTNQVGFTRSLRTMQQDCSLMPTPHFQDICVGGVISSLSYRFVGDSQKIIDFCSMVDPQNQETCFKQMGTSVRDWSIDTDLSKKECQKIPNTQGQTWCMDAL